MVLSNGCFMNDSRDYTKYVLDTLKTNDNRLANFYVNYLSNIELFEKRCRRNEKYYFYQNNDDLKSIQSKLKNTIDTLIPNREELDDAINLGMINIISIEHFTWLKDNSYACAYCWGILSERERDIFTAPPYKIFDLDRDINKNTSWYDFLGLSKQCMNHEERYNTILNIFDGVFFEDGGDKQNALDSLKKLWLKVNDEIKNFKFIDDNSPEHVNWLFDYFNKYKSQAISHKTGFIISARKENDLQHYLSIYPKTNLVDKITAAYSALRLWDTPDFIYERKVFIDNTKKAWKQRGVRRNDPSKTSISSVIGVNEKEKLDEMAKHYRVNKNTFLEKIINKQYEKYQKDPSDLNI